VAVSIAVPVGVLAYVLIPPTSEVRLDDAVQHFTITTNVALVAAAVALVVARAALDMRHWPSVLTALGFMSLAGIFVVHGLATPGVIMTGNNLKWAGAVVALSAQLSIGVPAWLFAARYTGPVTRWVGRNAWLTPQRLIGAFSIAILAYAAMFLIRPRIASDMLTALTGTDLAHAYDSFGGSPLQAGGAIVAVESVVTVALLLYAAARSAAEFARSRMPSHAALSLAFLFLAEAQVAMVLGPVFSGSFWEYHFLMATATLLALGALVLELDRRRGLERFLPPTVVERVIVGDHLSLEGERRTATILFTDLRGSTTLAERLSPEAAVATVNAYLRAMARAVIDEGGILDKFTGDGIMSIFGAMADPASGAAAAARAALRMRADIAAINAERTARGEPVIGYGVGINTGDVVLGAVGLPERSDYTAMGDTVNTAARMESLTKELGVDVVVSDSAARYLEDGITLRPLGDAMVKGKSAPVAVFTIA
jgi:class 3 adenylate cyclase